MLTQLLLVLFPVKKNNDHFSKLIADIKKRQAEKKAKKEDTKVDENAPAEKKIGKITMGGRNVKKTTGKEMDGAGSKERETMRGDRNVSKITKKENKKEEIIKWKNRGKSINHKNTTVSPFSNQTHSLASESEESSEETESSPAKIFKLSQIHQNIGEKRSKDDQKNTNEVKMGDTISGQDSSLAGDYDYIRAMKSSHKKIMHNPEEIQRTESTAVNSQQDNTNRSSEMQSLNHCTNNLMLAASHTDDKQKGESEVDPSPDLFSSSPAISEDSNASFSLLANTQPLSPPCLLADLGECINSCEFL